MTGRPRSRRRLTTVLASALLAVSIGAAQPGQHSTSQGQAATCAGRVLDGNVTVVMAPDFPTPPAGLIGGRRGHLVDFAVDPVRGLRAWATDGYSIARTDDGGCTWNVVFGLADTSAPASTDGATNAVMALAVPQGNAGADHLYALVQDLSVPNTTARFAVLATEDGGRSFQLRGQGLPAVNLSADADRCGDDEACGIATTGRNDVLYLRFASSNGTLVYASDDGARTFTARSAGAAFVEAGGEGADVRGPLLTDLEVDPAVPNVLWGTSGPDGPATSDDGAETFNRVEPFQAFELPLTEVRHVDLVNAEFGRGVLAVGRDASGLTRAALSFDEGSSFQPVDALGGVPGTATGAALTDRGAVAVATTRGLYVSGYVGSATTGAVDPKVAGADHAGLRHLQAVRRDGPGRPDTIWGLTDDQIVTVGLLPSGSPRIPPSTAPADLGAFDPFALEQTALGSLVGPDLISLLPGPDAVHDYDLEMPAVDVPVDVFFLLDETASMQDEFDALRGGIKKIAQNLASAGLDVNVGLGSYGNGYRYRLYRKIGPVDAEFLRKLGGIRTGGDGEVAYTGLHQMVTGTGLGRSRIGAGPRAGQQAQWRNGTVRMVIHVTDEGLSEEDAGPTAAEAIRVLKDAEVLHLGLIANDFTNGVATGVGPEVQNVKYDWQPMFDLARETGAFAPPGGIDCNNDGITDVQAGQPIACFLSPLTTDETFSQADAVDLIPEMADVIIAMLSNMTEQGVVSIHTRINNTLGATSPLLRGVNFGGGTNAQRVNLRVPQQIGVEALVRCTPELSGRSDLVDLVGVNGSVVLAATSVRITCGSRGVAAIGPAAAAAAPRGAAVAAQAPPPPPAPIQAPAPAQGAAQANAVSSANSSVPQVGAAAAQQEQQQRQAASIGPSGSNEDEPGVAYEFTARRDNRDAPVGATALGALAMTAGAAVLARRRQDQHVSRRADIR